MAHRNLATPDLDPTPSTHKRKKIQGAGAKARRLEAYRQRKNVENLSDIHLAMKLNTFEWPAYEFKYFKTRVDFFHPDFQREKENFLLWLAELAEEVYETDPDFEINTSISFNSVHCISQDDTSCNAQTSSLNDLTTPNVNPPSWCNDVRISDTQLSNTRLLASTFESRRVALLNLQRQQQLSVQLKEESKSLSALKSLHQDPQTTGSCQSECNSTFEEVSQQFQEQLLAKDIPVSTISSEVLGKITGDHGSPMVQIRHQQVLPKKDRRITPCSTALSLAISSGNPRHIREFLNCCELTHQNLKCVHKIRIVKYIYLAEYKILRDIFELVEVKMRNRKRIRRGHRFFPRHRKKKRKPRSRAVVLL